LADSNRRKMGQGWSKATLAWAHPMRRPSERDSQLLEDVKKLVVDLIATLQGKSATVQTDLHSGCTLLKIVPSDSHAAPIKIVVPTNADQKGVTLIAGRGSFFEIPRSGGRYTDAGFFDEIRTICEAVIAGGLEEFVTLHGDEVLQGKGRIELHGEPTKVRWRRLAFWPFRKKERKHFKYGPYQGRQ
jgi:hypothetical protein